MKIPGKSYANYDYGWELLYSYTLKTKVTEYGVSIKDILAGKAAPPPQGARFDVALEGVVHGPKVKGKVIGIDYINMRANGHAQLHIHAEITAEDGEKIALFAGGIATPEHGTGIFRLVENVTLTTASPKYSWVNKLQVWGQGTFDPVRGEVKINGYSA